MDNQFDRPQPAPATRTLIGMLTPSSNTILEPVTAKLLLDFPGASAHFSRFTVTKISTEQQALEQFSTLPMLEAASLLADAKVDVICWNGTSASWLGLDRDVELCEGIKARTGIPATSAVLSMAQAFRLFGATRVGLVTPYVDDIQNMIVGNLSSEGFDCVAEEHAGETDNFAFSLITEDQIAAMVRRVAAEKPDAIAILCTNLDGARIAATLEKEIGIPVFDSISLSVWGCLRALGVDVKKLARWGRLFEENISAPTLGGS
tara:strand:+ start:1186 stop:1971 length:786 start_codon:yes stop_codon:yes gene_type:complete